MLYSVLPPLIFFVSFGGIILVVSRVVLRVRREDLSHAIRVEAASAISPLPEKLFHSGTVGVELLKSPFALLAKSSKQAVADVKTYWQTRQERKAAKQALQSAQQEVASEVPTTAGIQMPTIHWTQKAGGLLQRSKQAIGNLANRTKEQVADSAAHTTAVPLTSTAADKEEVRPAPNIRIIRVDTPMTKTAQVEKQAESVPGRFIARIKKEETPLSGILQQVGDAIEAGQLERAEEMLVPYIVKHTKDCEAYMLLGKVAVAKGSWEEAMEVFQQVVHINPDLTDAQASLGYAALQQGRFTVALQALQRAHAADPENLKILEQILNIAKRLDNKVLQKSVLQQVIELQPNNEKAAQDLAALLAQEKAHV